MPYQGTALSEEDIRTILQQIWALQRRDNRMTLLEELPSFLNYPKPDLDCPKCEYGLLTYAESDGKYLSCILCGSEKEID